MTSAVKSRRPSCCFSIYMFAPYPIRWRRRSQYCRRLLKLIFADWLPQYWIPSMRLPRSRHASRRIVSRMSVA